MPHHRLPERTRYCDCCAHAGTRAVTDACGCDAVQVPPTPHFLLPWRAWWGVRCGQCHQCPAHCRCERSLSVQPTRSAVC